MLMKNSEDVRTSQLDERRYWSRQVYQLPSLTILSKNICKSSHLEAAVAHELTIGQLQYDSGSRKCARKLIVATLRCERRKEPVITVCISLDKARIYI